MRELDILYPIHREQFLKSLRRQTDSWERGDNDETTTHKRRGRKPTKPNKNVETEPNTKMYAVSSSSKYNWFEQSK
jgi:hypothetical protein